MITRDDILHFALALPLGDREMVAVALQDSLEAERDPVATLAGNEFHEELQRRSAAYRAGGTQARPAADVLAEMYRRQTEVTSP